MNGSPVAFRCDKMDLDWKWIGTGWCRSTRKELPDSGLPGERDLLGWEAIGIGVGVGQNGIHHVDL